MNKVSIYGGLGNQMFQYALCVALNQHGRKTRITFSNFLYEDYHNGFDLGRAFNLKLPFRQNLLNFFIMNFGLLYKNRFANRVVKKNIQRNQNKGYTIYREAAEFRYDENVFDQRSALLIGTWQAEAYFKDVKSKVQQEFRFRIPRDKKNRMLIRKIDNCNSISIHIRRGDYLGIQWAKTHAVIKDATYYFNAAAYIEKKVGNPHYFIFSDDVNWAKENLKFPDCTYVDHNKGKSSYIDMYLMSLCRHNIIANSTFSWWAAWLNKNENKIVIMPERWINGNDCPGIFPYEWVKIKV